MSEKKSYDVIITIAGFTLGAACRFIWEAFKDPSQFPTRDEKIFQERNNPISITSDDY